MNPIDEYNAQQRDYEEARYAKLLQDMQPANFCAEEEPYPEDDEDEVSTVRVLFGFIALVALAVIGLCWHTAPVQAVLHFLRMQP